MISTDEEKEAKPGDELNFDWQVPESDSQPIAWVGVEISSTSGTDATINLDYLTWSGAPTLNLGRPTGGPDGIERFKGNSKGLMWKPERGVAPRTTPLTSGSSNLQPTLDAQ